MNVGELKKLIEHCDEDMPVVIWNDNNDYGLAYGTVNFIDELYDDGSLLNTDTQMAVILYE